MYINILHLYNYWKIWKEWCIYLTTPTYKEKT